MGYKINLANERITIYISKNPSCPTKCVSNAFALRSLLSTSKIKKHYEVFNFCLFHGLMAQLVIAGEAKLPIGWKLMTGNCLKPKKQKKTKKNQISLRHQVG